MGVSVGGGEVSVGGSSVSFVGGTFVKVGACVGRMASVSGDEVISNGGIAVGVLHATNVVTIKTRMKIIF